MVENEEIILGGDISGDPTVDGAMRYDAGSFRFKDALGVFNPRDGGAMPPSTQAGQVLSSVDGLVFTANLPLTTTDSGWLVNEDGILLVVG